MSEPTVFAEHPRQLLNRHPVARPILAAVASQVVNLQAAGHLLRLVSLIIGDTAPAQVYVRNQRRVANEVGIDFVEKTLLAATTQADPLKLIECLGVDPQVAGIIIRRPVPAHLSVKQLQGAIQPAKDVEGMHPHSIGEIVYGLSDIGPCTVLAAVEMPRQTGLGLPGLEVVIIGHSEIVGKPIALRLMAAGATVTLCHHLTRSVRMYSCRADAVFVAVGRPQLVDADMIKPGAAVIDIGIDEVDMPGTRRRLAGNVDFESLSQVVGWLMPVPGGVGSVTLSILMLNTLFAAERQIQGARLRSLSAG